MKIAIIGAGISGCNLYFNLKEKYNDITIFEKSRGTGGRLSTKYVSSNDLSKIKFIDHGTSSLTPQTDELKDLCLYLSKNNILKSRYDMFIPKNGINKICSYLIDKKDLITNTKISKVTYQNSKWYLEDEDNNSYKNFDLLFITIPAKQILEINISLNNDILNKLKSVEYDSVFSLILYSNSEDIKLNENILYKNENIDNIINNSKKYLYKDFSSYVVHATKKFSNENKYLSKDEIYKILINSFSDEIMKELKAFTIIPHLWRYAFTKNSLDIPYYFDKKTNLGICGDYFTYNNIEGAYLSSSMLSDKFI